MLRVEVAANRVLAGVEISGPVSVGLGAVRKIFSLKKLLKYFYKILPFSNRFLAEIILGLPVFNVYRPIVPRPLPDLLEQALVSVPELLVKYFPLF